MSKVGKYFEMEEFTVSQEGARRGWDNTPPSGGDVENSIKALVEHILDPFREEVDRPVVVSSGYRSPKINAAIGGAKNSQHTKGEAADILVPGMSVEDVVHVIRTMGLPFDQLINEFGSWTHVSYRPHGRREVLKAKTTKKGTIYDRLG